MRHVVDGGRRRYLPLSHGRTGRVQPPPVGLRVRSNGTPLRHAGDRDDGARPGRVDGVPVLWHRDGREGCVGVEGRHPGI